MNNRFVCPNASAQAGSKPENSTQPHETVEDIGKGDIIVKPHKCLKSNCANWRENKCIIFKKMMEGLQTAPDKQLHMHQDSLTDF